jgi:hypothetical protein
MNSIFRIVENILPEGYITYAICPSLADAVALISANRPRFQQSLHSDELVIEEVPLNQLELLTNVNGEALAMEW